MAYTANEVAKYIITKCNECGKSVSNLKLQKMLYFLWVEYYKIKKRELFYDEICAWQLGPVVPDVYYDYCSYAGRPINMNYDVMISKEDKDVLDKIIDEYSLYTAASLVDMTHKSGTAWDTVYRGGIGNRCPIPFELIKTKECIG